mmetsp:Transcript_17158/g.50422  ORF Transcript_17158/g.50422 Transcript_17158/m.50422 type:complete len:354 (-) Transcript_17158:349-1410(-)
MRSGRRDSPRGYERAGSPRHARRRASARSGNGGDPRGVRARAGRSCRRQGRAPGPGRRRRVGRLARLRLRRQLLRRDGRVRRRLRQLVPLCVRRLDAAAARRVALPGLQEAEEAPRREAAGAAPVASEEEEGEPRPLERRTKGPRGARGARREGAAATLRGRHGPGRPRLRGRGVLFVGPQGLRAAAPAPRQHRGGAQARQAPAVVGGQGLGRAQEGLRVPAREPREVGPQTIGGVRPPVLGPREGGLGREAGLRGELAEQLYFTGAGRRPKGAEGPRGGRRPREGAGRGEVPEVRLPREPHRAAAELAQRRAAFASSSRFPHARGLWRRHRDDPDGGAALDHSLAQGHGIRL